MSEPKYTDEQFIAAIRKAVEIRGEDYVYPSKEEHPEYWVNSYVNNADDPSGLICRYQLEDGNPACIIGLALHEIDPRLVPPSRYWQGADRALSRVGFEGKALQQAAWDAQSVQDDFCTWGEALQTFEDSYQEHKSRENRL